MNTLKMYIAAKNVFNSTDNQNSFKDYLIGSLTVKVTEQQMQESIDTAMQCMDRQLSGRGL
jgi:ribosome-associated translation inhibitor RaiA